jgi:hypothetical protein
LSGWRDTEGRTRGVRKQEEQAVDRTRFMNRLKHQPLSLLRPALFALFVLAVIAALALR